MLKQETREEYSNNGFVILRNTLNSELLNNLKKQFFQHYNLEKRTNISLAKHSIREKFPQLNELIFNKQIVSVAKALLGTEDIQLWQEQLIVKPPYKGKESAWHQDYCFWPMTKPSALTCWIPLHDVNNQTGCMRFLAGSNLWNNEPTIMPQSLADICDSSNSRQPVKIIDCPMKIGDCSFHSGVTFHGATRNRSSAYRLAYKIVYMSSSTLYRTLSHSMTNNYSFNDGELISGKDFPKC